MPFPTWKESFMTDTTRISRVPKYLLVALLLASLAALYAGVAHAFEIIPSLGLTKSTDASAGDAKASGGLALRMPLMSFLKAEGGISYRQDSFSDGEATIKQWPVTLSLWASPFPMLYAGGGIGWYRTTIDYASDLPFKDTTSMTTGVHLGGGFLVPIATNLSLDLNGRYIFMSKDNNNVQVPTTFDPDYWTTSLGLAIRF
jgi:opacity protein-like surface antigen